MLDRWYRSIVSRSVLAAPLYPIQIVQAIKFDKNTRREVHGSYTASCQADCWLKIAVDSKSISALSLSTKIKNRSPGWSQVMNLSDTPL